MMVSPSSEPASPSGPQATGRYVVSAALGQGATGSVYRAVDALTGRAVALKVFAPLAPAGASDGFRERVLRAADAARTLNHPNIVAIHDFGECEDGAPYVVMEALSGLTLRDGIDSGIVLPPPKVLDIALRVLDGLEHAHGRGVVHGDLKPANVMLAHHGTVKILDFGIALALDARRPAAEPLASPIYLAPEQLPAGAADARSDLFALGIILYELLTGTHPFADDTAPAVLHNIVHLDPAPPRELNPDLPEGLDEVVMRALAKDPAERFASARAMRDALADVCVAARGDATASTARAEVVQAAPEAGGAGVAGAWDSSFPAPDDPPPRPRWQRAAALAAALALVVLGALVALSGRDPVPAAPPVKPAGPTASPPAVMTATIGPTEVVSPAYADPPPSYDAPDTDSRTEEAAPEAKPETSRPPAPPEGRLQLAVLPWGEIHVDGSRRAVTPPQRVLSLPPGVYRVEIRNGNFPPRVQKVRIEAGKSVSIRHRFE